MIALLIGGTVVFCVGVLTVVFGIPIKEFSFGNTMILAGAVVACAGLLLIGLYIVGRELKNLALRLDAGSPREQSNATLSRNGSAQPAGAPQIAARSQPRARKDEMLFTRDQPGDFDDNEGDMPRPMPTLPSATAPPLSESWQDEPVRSRPASPVADGGERQRRDILFSSKRRDQSSENDSFDDFSDRNAAQDGSSFENAWQQSDRPQQDSPAQRNGRSAPTRPSMDARPPRRADAASVSIVKSGVVDSMAYSLYSDGSIEAQMPEGMVRFASIEELRGHLDQR